MALAILAPLSVLAQEVAERDFSRGTWRYRQIRNETPVFCRAKGPLECITHTLLVENASGDTLECESQMTYDGLNNEGLSSMRALRVVLPRQSTKVMNDRAKPDISLTHATVDCKVRAPRPLLNVPSGCAFQILEAPPLEEFYPPASRRLSEEGPVELSFTLDRAQGHASGLTVVGSSLSERLDRAAVKYIESLTFSTRCPTTRFELRVMFKLNE